MKNKANADKWRDVDDELHVYNHSCLDEWSTFKAEWNFLKTKIVSIIKAIV